MGRLVLADVHKGRNMAGVKRGEIKKLLVPEALPKPVHFSGGMEPLTFSGSFTLERILGTVPVEEDGSAHFEAPPLRSLFFVALDENDLSVKRTQSFCMVQPGETFSCVGCHEHRTEAPVTTGHLMAMRRPPSQIQPILDKHCVACHDYDATPKGGPRAGGVILSGDRGPLYSHSYFRLTALRQFSDGRNQARSNYPPRALGSSASPLLKKGDGDHYEAKLSVHEKKLIRLWIETAAPYPGTYAALGSGMVAGQGRSKQTLAVLERRCGQCHTGKKELPDHPGDSQKFTGANESSPRYSPHILYNLTRPEKSLLLWAPLAKTAGGLGVCGAAAEPKPKPKTENPEPSVPVFLTAADPDYKTLLAAVKATQQALEAIKRFDMPGFRPNEHYVREMKFYGILSRDLPADAPINPYEADQAYWRSLWHRPVAR